MMLWPSNGTSRGVGRLGADGDHDVARRVFVGFVILPDGDAVRLNDGRCADDEIDAVSNQLVLDDFLLGLNHVVATLGEIFEGNVFLDAVTGAIEIALAEAGQEQHRFAQGFTRDGAAVDADAAGNFFPLNDADPFADLGRLNGGFLSGRAGTDDQHVIMGHGLLP
jgi:hypothetical protein